MVGAVLISDGSNSSGNDGIVELLTVGRGDALVILSAVFYSLHVVRLGKYAKDTSAVQLASSKAAFELLFSFVAIIISTTVLHDQKIPAYVSSLGSGSPDVGAVVLVRTLLWNGAFTTAFTMWCQSAGQQRVPPTEANLIYTSQPIWAILIAHFALNEELGPSLIPGMLLLVSSIAISLSGDRKDSKDYI